MAWRRACSIEIGAALGLALATGAAAILEALAAAGSSVAGGDAAGCSQRA